MSKKILTVLVDEKDTVLGFREKWATHKIPVPLHRAISIVIFNNKDKSRMLITKRIHMKPTWGGYWTNAVCTNVAPNETYQECADRRLFEELGFKTKLKEVFRFTYKADMDNGIWGEHGLDAVFVGLYQGDIHPDPSEVDGYDWITIEDLKKDLKKNPKKYTPWFKIILKKLEIV
jgi:isopentenyl-diphosphate delta-isomerase